ncbi:MAG TPA: protein kinase [Gemmatimonadaceae bacterium]|nr:protein kinase [Gemmatimonadaceae bacterium]
MSVCDHCATELPDAARFCFVCGRDVATAATPTKPYVEADAVGKLRARLAKSLDGRYAIREILGAGGMGVVFRADDLSLGRPVAIKVLPTELSDDKNVVARFRREAKTAASLDHPGIIPVLAVESDNGLHYFVMKYVSGQTLEATLRDGPLPIPLAVQVLREAATALAHAHRNGVVHRDVKPANIMLEDERVVVTDFGISKVETTASSSATTAARLTDLGMVVGTPAYMAPEQAVGQPVDGRTDQYALGVVGFEMLAGKVPFDDVTPHAIIQRHISNLPPDLATLRPDAPRHVVAAISRALSKSPANRFATMEEFAAALAGAGSRGTANLEFTVPVANVSEAAPPVAMRKRSRAGRWAAVIALMLVGVAAAAARARGSRETPTRVAENAPAARPSSKSSTASSTAGSRQSRTRAVLFSVDSKPRATIYVNDVHVGQTPLVGHRLISGREYRIVAIRAGYRPKRETITVTGSAPIRRSYVLERARR